MMMRSIALLLSVVLGHFAMAQEPSVDVASIRPNDTPITDLLSANARVSPGQIRLVNVSLQGMIINAYKVPLTAVARVKFDVENVPAGLLASKFDVVAKGAGDPSAMLLIILKDRFGLRAHTEMRQLRGYAVTVWRSGRLGPKLRPASVNCREYVAGGGSKSDAPEPCKFGTKPGNGSLVDKSAGTIDDLIMRTAQPAFRDPVVDLTGLRGNFEWDLTFSLGENGPSPTIVDAFEDQLGLKIESRTVSYEVIVVDDLHLPTPN
jgi:uncharacterized protein (TIGR03435 family)